MKYTDKVLDHFKNPRNQGSIENADLVGMAGNPTCGDVMKLYLVLDKGRIKDVKFETLGCAAAIAVSSVFTEMIKGKDIEEASKITKEDVVKELGDLPPVKVHCSILALDAFKNAFTDGDMATEACDHCDHNCEHHH